MNNNGMGLSSAAGFLVEVARDAPTDFAVLSDKQAAFLWRIARKLYNGIDPTETEKKKLEDDFSYTWD
jgi:hypothetical protein